MEEKNHKKGLHIKVAVISLISTILPLILFIFFINNALYAIALGVFIAFLSIFILFKIIKPLSLLLKGTDALRDGNLNYRFDIRSNDEFEEVAQSFNLTADSLKTAFEKVEHDKEVIATERNQLSAVFSSVIDGIIAIDFSKNVVFANKAAEYLTGYTLSEMQGRSIDQFVHLFNDLEEIPSKVYCQFNLGTAQTNNFGQSLKLVSRDGKQSMVYLSTSSITEGIQTNLGCIIILRDLTRESELEQMKLDFVSMASHELRTPLTNIIGYLSVFINENREKIAKEELNLLDRSLISAKQLLTLVANLLSVNKIERQQLSVSIETVDLENQMKKVIEDLQNQAKLKNITLVLIPPTSPLPKILADPLRIGEVINNLVVNAINYTNPGGKIEISTEVTPTEVVTTISDNGVGIPKEAIPQLFNKFFRVSNRQQKADKGTGLGLYISKSIITKLNGKIWVESEVGKGSKFHFSLPIVPQSRITNNDKFIHQAIQSGVLNY